MDDVRAQHEVEYAEFIRTRDGLLSEVAQVTVERDAYLEALREAREEAKNGQPAKEMRFKHAALLGEYQAAVKSAALLTIERDQLRELCDAHQSVNGDKVGDVEKLRAQLVAAMSESQVLQMELDNVRSQLAIANEDRMKLLIERGPDEHGDTGSG